MHEPLFNLPPVTQYFILALVAIHLFVTIFLSPEAEIFSITHFGFISAAYTGAEGLPLWSLVIAPFSYAFLHGSWMHLIMNCVMLMAFGSGLEKWMSGRRMLILFFGCSLVAIFLHFILNMDSFGPVIGASGGLSGLFAAAIVMLSERGMMPSGRRGIMIFVLLWIAISVLFGLMGGPDGSAIAWEAHIGGFLAGFVLLKPVLRLPQR